MAIERAPDGSVRVPGTDRLAGSSLALDQAVRNVVAWGLAAPAVAIAMASTNPAALLGLQWDFGTVEWTDDLRPKISRPH
jgi:N-acetylglucosamine-6-phosphate deacetylase